MPLRVHLPPPPPGLFEDPQAIYDSVRDGVLDWAAFQPRFGVARILVTARWSGGRVADLHDVHRVLLHEMGHALGLGGHSPRPGDIMYPSISQAGRGLSERDRATLAALYGLPIGRRVTGAKHER